ncbi:MAG TPA: hypothetical protein VGM29_05865 [Polyangiaceae bacterium]
MSLSSTTSRLFVSLLLASGIGAGACSTQSSSSHGVCVVSADSALGCNGVPDPDGGATPNLGLVGYSCTGSARPDEAPTYADGVPQGVVCADRGALADGTQGYCCSEALTPCALNPVAICDAPNYGYQCRGSQRPEAFVSDLECGQGIYEGDLIDYCCSGFPQTDGCTQTDSAGCSDNMMGFICTAGNMPKAEQLGANQSRADVYRLLCSVPTILPSAQSYCCYTPALPPVGGTCVPDSLVPGCAAGRFGIACYGPDTPGQDYPGMACPDPGVAGRDAEGYLATLYCCDFQ